MEDAEKSIATIFSYSCTSSASSSDFGVFFLTRLQCNIHTMCESETRFCLRCLPVNWLTDKVQLSPGSGEMQKECRERYTYSDKTWPIVCKAAIVIAQQHKTKGSSCGRIIRYNNLIAAAPKWQMWSDLSEGVHYSRRRPARSWPPIEMDNPNALSSLEWTLKSAAVEEEARLAAWWPRAAQVVWKKTKALFLLLSETCINRVSVGSSIV